MNAEGQSEAELLIMVNNRAPEFGLSRSVSLASQPTQRNVAEFIESAFRGGSDDQHQNKDAGQDYFRFHGCCWWLVIGGWWSVAAYHRQPIAAYRVLAK